jgi:DNA-binding MarR family transcriptional regulator
MSVQEKPATTGESKVRTFPDSVVEEVSRAFFDLTIRNFSRFHAIAAEFGLSPFQAKALGCVFDSQGRTMSTMASAIGCNASNLTGVIDKLEARGLVRREASPSDRRIKMVCLSEAGGALRERLIERLRQPPDWMLALSPGEQRQLRDILNKGIALDQSDKDGSAH